MLQQHDSKLRDQPSHDRQDRICLAFRHLYSLESIHYKSLHCLAHEWRRAALRALLAALPAAHAFPSVPLDDEGVVAFWRDDFMGGAKAALIAAEAFLHAVITFENIFVEHFEARPTFDNTLHLHILALHVWIACA